jgi:hypothetical protein
MLSKQYMSLVLALTICSVAYGVTGNDMYDAYKG